MNQQDMRYMTWHWPKHSYRKCMRLGQPTWWRMMNRQGMRYTPKIRPMRMYQQ